MRPGRVILVLVAFLVLGEVGARIGEAVSDKQLSDSGESGRASLYGPHPYIGYVLRPGAVSDPKRKRQYRVNSLGFRGAEVPREKPAGTYRIVCLGGSTTWGWDSYSDEKTWPDLLQRSLNKAGAPNGFERVEVINAGVPGYTLMESFVNLKMRVLPLQPDLVIVYHAANDARLIARGDVQPDYTHARRVWTETVQVSPMEQLFGWSALYGLLAGAKGRALELDGLLHVPEFETLPLREAAEVDEGLEIVETTLREMAALTRLHGVELALCTFAWSRDPHPKPSMQTWMDHQVSVMERVNDVIRSAALSEGTRLIDVNANGPQAREDFSDIIHLTDVGRRKLAQSISKALAN